MNSQVIINVDDNEPTRYFRARILKRAGFEVYDAATGAAALALVEKYSPDLILLDVHLPDLDGREVCRRIRGITSGPSVIVVQISASALGAMQATNALDNGADAYLTEPVDPDVLVATVRAMLRLRDAEKSLFLTNQKLESTNKELQRLNDDLEQFAFAASHDIQEPLRTMTSLLQLLQQQISDRLDERQNMFLGYVLDAATRMRNLVMAILSYSQVGRGVGATLRPVDLNSVYAKVLDNLRDQIAESQAVIQVRGRLPIVQCEPVHLSQLLQNLLINAMKYIRPNVPPHIVLEADLEESGLWRIAIHDNGIGIEPQNLDRIFVPFKRLHGQEIPGTGIGLAYCRRMVDFCGGRIWAESEPGKGSTFFFTLKPAEGETDAA